MMVDRNIPTHRLVTCEGCGMQLDAEGHGTFRQIAVWLNVTTRARLMPSELPVARFLCDLCIDRVKEGIPAGQLTFGDALA